MSVPSSQKTSKIHPNVAKNCFENPKKNEKQNFFRFFQIQFWSNLWHPNAVWRYLGPQSVLGSFLNHFKTILNNFLKIDFGIFGKPIFTFALLKRFENAQNKRFWGFQFSKNTLNGGLLEHPLSMGETQGDNKKICQIDFWLNAVFHPKKGWEAFQSHLKHTKLFFKRKSYANGGF